MSVSWTARSPASCSGRIPRNGTASALLRPLGREYIVAQDHGTLDNFSFLGTWWLPEKPETKVSGLLGYDSDEGVKLELHAPLESGTFAHPLAEKVKIGEREFGRTFGPPLIHGVHDDGRPCTVFGARHVCDHLGGGLARRSEYKATALLMGKLVESVDDPLTGAVRFRFTYIEHWLAAEPFSARYLMNGDIQEGTEITYRYPPVITADVPKHGLTLATNPRRDESQSHTESSVTLRHRDELLLKSTTPWTADQCLQLLFDLRTLLTLLLDMPIYFTEVMVSGGPVQVGDDEFIPNALLLYFPQPFRRLRKDLRPNDFLFPFAEIKDKLGAIVTTWMDGAAQLRSVYELVSSVFYGARMTPQVGLLTLTQAFETFHRAVIGGEYMKKEDYEAVRAALAQAIPAVVPDDHRDALKTRIKFGNSFSMRKRIDTALKSLGDSAVNQITRKRSEFGSKIADTRNYLTHRDESSRGLVIHEENLGAAAEKFRYFFTILLMRTLGIPPDDTIAAIRRTFRQSWVLDWDGL